LYQGLRINKGRDDAEVRQSQKKMKKSNAQVMTPSLHVTHKDGISLIQKAEGA